MGGIRFKEESFSSSAVALAFHKQFFSSDNSPSEKKLPRRKKKLFLFTFHSEIYTEREEKQAEEMNFHIGFGFHAIIMASLFVGNFKSRYGTQEEAASVYRAPSGSSFYFAN
jgi:hypothetical protein